jgi:hypothetical protein
MLSGETWLIHSDLFKKYWEVETKSWVQSLGWFDNVINESKVSSGWMIFGDKELSILDYVNIIDEKDSEKKMYCYNNGNWSYISSPVLFIVKKSDDEIFITGWAGDPQNINQLKKKYENYWDWSDLTTIPVDPRAISFKKNKEESIHFQNVQTKLPVFFSSNGETNAEQHWARLKSICPRAIRVDGIHNRRDMFIKCVELSENYTHFFLVTAKNFVTDATVFDYIPDESTPRAHIIFQAKNMSNKLEYGHMAIGCYNVDLVLNTPKNFGLDFTEYSKVYQIPRTVSEAYFANTPYEAWRTAFRETVKLTLKETHTAEFWLNRWLSFASGQNSDWVLSGAKDGKEYALKYKFDNKELVKSESWNWLQEYFDKIYKSEK